MFKNITSVAVQFLILTSISIAQINKHGASPSSVSAAALAYFEKIQNQSFDDYLKRIRPGHLSPELKARVLALLPKEDIVNPSTKAQAKLRALEPILKYHDRNSLIDLKIIRVGKANVLFLAGAAVLISEGALNLLTAEELQAVIAHELGHEYFWNEWQEAHMNKQYDKMKEIELRCDGLAVITMSHLGLDPSHFISAVTRMTKLNGSSGINAEYYTSLEERVRFIRAMIEMVKAKEHAQWPVARN